MEGKTYTITSLSEKHDEDDSHENKLGVNNFINSVKNPPFYISVKIMDRIANYCLIYGGFVPSVMSKIIVEEIGLSVQMKI
jgi:hypothetical protein